MEHLTAHCDITTSEIYNCCRGRNSYIHESGPAHPKRHLSLNAIDTTDKVSGVTKYLLLPTHTIAVDYNSDQTWHQTSPEAKEQTQTGLRDTRQTRHTRNSTKYCNSRRIMFTCFLTRSKMKYIIF